MAVSISFLGGDMAILYYLVDTDVISTQFPEEVFNNYNHLILIT